MGWLDDTHEDVDTDTFKATVLLIDGWDTVETKNVDAQEAMVRRWQPLVTTGSFWDLVSTLRDANEGNVTVEGHKITIQLDKKASRSKVILTDLPIRIAERRSSSAHS